MRRQWNYSTNSPRIRRAFRRAARIRRMSIMHWQAYIDLKPQKLIHKGGKP